MLSRNKFCIAAAAMLALSACKQEDAARTETAVPSVEAVRTAAEDIPLSFEFSARAQGSKETEVRARVGGILLKRNYVEGSPVNAGDILFQIDPEPYKVQLAQAKAKLSQEQAQLKAAETQWLRIDKLFKDRIVSEKSRDEARANLDSLKATTALAEAEVQAAQLNLDYTTVTAPISGITSMETQSEGSLIGTSANDSLLTHITQLDPIYVIFSAADNDAFKLGSLVDSGKIVTSNGSRRSDVFARLKFGNDSFYDREGKIDFINPSIDEQTGTIKLRAVFPNPERKILPGQFGRIVLEGLIRKDAIVLPQEAVMQGAKSPYVYRLNAQNQVEAVNVSTGFTTPRGWIIDSGLNPGDVVLVSGLMKVRPGQQVNPVFNETETASSAQ